MTSAEAARTLDLPVDATPEQLETRFLELRTKLEDRIAKAPTPGLKAKYRESLDEVTKAFETLTLASDASSLPVVRRSEKPEGDRSPPAGIRQAAPNPQPSTLNPPSSANRKPKAKGFEFLIVAVLAIAVLGGAGWWLTKTRAEKAEAARIAAEQQAESERQALAAKAEKERLAEVARIEAEEKQKAAEAAKQRRAKLTAELRSRLAEYKIAWDSLEREERKADRDLNEAKSELRSLRDAPAPRLVEARAIVEANEEYFDWLSKTLSRHPARLSRGRAEELLSGGELESAEAAIDETAQHLKELEAEITAQRTALLDLNGELVIATNADATWNFTDAFGRTRSGKGPAKLTDVAIGNVEIKFNRPLWPQRTETTLIRRTRPASVEVVYKGETAVITSEPEGAQVLGKDGAVLGRTPLKLEDLAPGSYSLVLKLEGHYDKRASFTMPLADGGLPTIKLVRSGSLDAPQWAPFPQRMKAESRTTTVTDTTRSTGALGADAKVETTVLHFVEEWTGSNPDAQGEFTVFDRKFVHSSLPQVPSGVVIRLTRGTDGKWAGKLAGGSIPDEIYRNAFVSASVHPATPPAWLTKIWPPSGAQPGTEWKIAPADYPYSVVKTGNVTGRVLSAGDGILALQFVHDSGPPPESAETRTRSSGTVRVRIDLAAGRLVSVDSTSTYSLSTKPSLLIGSQVIEVSTQSQVSYSYE